MKLSKMKKNQLVNNMAPKKGHYPGSGDGSEFNDKSHVNRNPNPEMDRLVKPVNELRNLFSRLERPLDLGLPRIVAIGGQSSGKSSTIENFVGRDFLPRGSGLVTRRPLVLHLVNNQGSEDEEEYGVFEHKRGDDERFYDFDEIRKEIVAETDRTTAREEISELEIILTLYSPHYVDVSLVDMPGLVRTALPGQSEDIVDIIHNLNTKYAVNENTIILAVSVANGDIANSDAMEFVRKYDPTGERSIGVLTKLDIMDKGTDAKKILLNKVIPLELGWIGLVNRCQEDIDKHKIITDARKDEENYFKNSPVYNEIAYRMGSKFLQKYLGQILQVKVKEALPKVKDDIKSGLSLTKNELKMLPKMLEPKEMEMKMNDLLIDLNNAFKENIRGVGEYVSTTEENAGAKISTILIDGYKKYLDEVFLDENIIDHIKIAIKNTHGIEKGYFAPNPAVKAVIRSQIEKFIEPSISCIGDIFQELDRTLTKVSNLLRMYPNLRYEVEKKSQSKLEFLVENACNDFNDFIMSEKSYINFQHPDFIGFEKLSKYVKLGKLELKSIKDSKLKKQAMKLSVSEISLEDWKKQVFKGIPSKKSFYVLATKERVEFYGYDLTCCFWFARFDVDNQKEKNFRGEKFWSEQETFQVYEYEDENEITITNTVFETLFDGDDKITFTFENEKDLKEWKEILVTKSNVQVSNERKQLAHNFMLVISYKKILNTIFMDRLPKTVLQKIVGKMDIYLQKGLPFEIKSELDVEDMMCMSPDDYQKVEELTSQKEGYEAAMKIIEKMNFLDVSK